MCAFGPRTSPTTMSSSPRCAASHAASTTAGISETCDDMCLLGDGWTLEQPREPLAQRRIWVELHLHAFARPQHPRHVRDVREAVLGAAEPRPLLEGRVEAIELLGEERVRAGLAAAQRVIRLRERVVPEDAQPRERAVGRVGGEERRIGIALLEVLHDHRRLRERPAVLLDDGNAPGRVLLVDPPWPIVEVDLDRLEFDVLLGEDDAHARAVRTARRVVQRQHQATPSTDAICSYSSCAGGSSAGVAAVRAVSRTRCGSAPVSLAVTIAFAPRA